MKKTIFILAGLVISTGGVAAHGGRTNSEGCHNCRTGSCAGEYHCHNGGGAPAPSYTPPRSATTPNVPVRAAATTSAASVAELEEMQKKVKELEGVLELKNNQEQGQDRIAEEDHKKVSDLEQERDALKESVTQAQQKAQRLQQEKDVLANEVATPSDHPAETGGASDIGSFATGAMAGAMGAVFGRRYVNRRVQKRN